MARTTNQPPTATQRNTAKTRADTNGRGSFDEQDQRSEDNQLGDNDERHEGLAAVRDEQDDERNDNRDERENANAREFGDNRERDERRDSGEYTEQGSRREQRPTLSAGLDTFAPVLEAWKQVFKSWSELTETVVKVQQEAFASMIGTGNTPAKDISPGDQRSGELAFSGSRAAASTPDRIERDRDNR